MSEDQTDTIIVIPLANDGNESEHKYLAPRSSMKSKRSIKRQNSGISLGPVQTSRVSDARREDGENIGKVAQHEAAVDPEQGRMPTGKEGHRDQFYECYRKVAGEYDKEFLKKHDDDLTTTLIFAGLFSAVTAAFAIEVDSQLQPDPGDETVALLRLLIYKIDNTTFGNDVPTLPQWTGPPRRLVHVQAILFASLAASLFSAFLAMLGKQWLNRYESTGMRVSVTERGHDRQRKLDGIDAWYFDAVMESLPFILQAALLLLGCALSLYLWDIDTTIALVVLGFTSFGLLFYLFITVAGVATESCPYQTPVSQLLCYLGQQFRNAFNHIFWHTTGAIRKSARTYYPWWSRGNTLRFLRDLVSKVPPAISDDARHVWKSIQATASLLPRFFRVRNRSQHINPTPQPRSTSQTAVLDLRCILWTLRTSFDQTVRTLALKYLKSVLELAKFDHSLVEDCFGIFTGAIRANDEGAEIASQELATASAGCFYRSFHRLAVLDPTSKTLEHICKSYPTTIPQADFTGFSSRHTITMITALATRAWKPLVWRCGDKPSDHDHILFAKDIAELAQTEYRPKRGVPDWILHFAFDHLTMDPLPPPSVVANCLKVGAIHLGCDVSDAATSGKSANAEEVLTLITQKLETMVKDSDQALVVNCFNVSTICATFDNQREGNTRGLERFTTVFAGRFYHTLHHLTVKGSTSRVLEDMRQRYREDFPHWIDLTSLRSRHIITVIDALISGYWSRRPIWRDDDRPSDDEHILFARGIAELAQAKYRPEQAVPAWTIDFAFDSLALDPLPPASVVTDCLKVIAIDLGCDVAASDESVQAEFVSNIITRKLETMVRADQELITSKHNAICALLPYAILLENHGQQGVGNAIMRVVRASKDYYFMSPIPSSYITTLLGKPTSPFRNWVITLLGPCVGWGDGLHGEDTVVGWTTAVSTVPDAEEVVWSVIGTLMQITDIDSIRHHIPIETWAWLKKRRSLPVADWGQLPGATPDAVRYIRGLGDFEIMKSYFLLVFSDWCGAPADTFNEVESSIKGEFGGIGMRGQREDLLNQLDSVREEIHAKRERNGEDHCSVKLEQYWRLKEVLLEMDREAAKTSD